LAIALRHQRSPQIADLWAELAAQHDGRDRWYLEALGIGAEGRWDSFLAAWLDRMDNRWQSSAGRVILWRSRAKTTPEFLAKIILDVATPPETLPRYFRALDRRAIHAISLSDGAYESTLRSNVIRRWITV
jgi:hypothetical protein